MKSKDFFSKLSDNIAGDEFKKILDAVPDFEIPDAAFSAFEESYLTVDRAASDRRVNGKLKHEHLDPIDRDIKKIFSVLGIDDNDVNKELDTYKKMARLASEVPSAIDKAKTVTGEASEELKKKLKTSEETNAEHMRRIESMNSEFATKEAALKSGFEKQLHDIRLDTELDKLSSSYTFADAYEERRSALQTALLGDIRTKNNLQFAANENGSAEIRVLDTDGKPRFNGNTAVTIKSLLDEVYKPFLKQSNANGQPNGQQQATTPTFQAPNTTAQMPRRNTG